MDSVCVIFDYDWSLINTNSDTYVFSELCPSVHSYVVNQSKTRRGQWTNIIDEGLVLLQKEHGVSIEQIRDCLASVPYLEPVLQALKECLTHSVPVYIVSDASQFFIDAFLDKMELNLDDTISHLNQVQGNEDRSGKESTEEDIFQPNQSTVFTNLSWIDPATGFLRVKSYHASHDCVLCPPNLCKGAVLVDNELVPQSLSSPSLSVKALLTCCKTYPHYKGLEKQRESERRKRSGKKRVIYVGDGNGDFCAATKLGEDDILLVRRDEEYPSALGLVTRIEKEKDRFPIKAKIVYWKTGDEILQVVRDAVKS